MTLALRCSLRAGPFSGWKHYTVSLVDGTFYKGLIKTSSCYHPDWRPVDPSEPAGHDAIDALIEVRLRNNLSAVSSHDVLVEVQNDMDIQSVWVLSMQLRLRPQESLDELLARRAGAR